MPTISKEHISFEGAQFCREIKVDSSGCFTIKLPPSLAAAGLGTEVSASTKDGVLKCFREALAEHAARQTTVRRVICYAFKDSSYIWDQERTRVIRETKGISFTSGTALSLCAEVFDESKTVKPSGIHYEYEPVESTIPQGFSFRNNSPSFQGKIAEHVIEHSPEAEAFFARLAFSMESVILQLAEGFKTPEAVRGLVAKGQLTLGG